MSTALYRLGRFCFRRRRLVTSVWLAVIALAAVGAAALSGPSSAQFNLGGAESQRAFDLLEERFPELHAGGATARIVFAAPADQRVTDPANVALIEDVVGLIAADPQAGSVLSPFGDRPLEAGLISADRRMAMAEIAYSVDPTLLDPTAHKTIAAAAEMGRAAGLTVEVAGTATEETPAFGPELIGLAVAAIVLIWTFGSLAAAGMPLLTGLAGVGVALLVITALTGMVPMSDFAPLLAIMIGLAVGIDYALFIVSRYRDELRADPEGEEAAGRALGTAGTAVTFAALTVVVALAALAFNGISLLTEMGLAAAFTVLVALAVSLTLLPAALGFAKGAVFAWPATARRRGPSGAPKPPLGRRWGTLLARRPWPALAAAALALGGLALPALDLRLGFIDEGGFPEETTQRKAFDLIAEGFGPGASGHLLVVADATGSSDPADGIGRVVAALEEADAVRDVFPAELDAAGTSGLIVVIPSDGPASQATERLVAHIRSEVARVGAEHGVEVVATGSTALQLDVTALSAGAVPPYLLVLVGISLLALLLVFRSLVVPLVAAAGFLATIAATFGVLVGVYQWGWLSALGVEPAGAVIALLPLVIVGVAFGLAMDYQFFVATRIREAYVSDPDARRAVVAGLARAARVVAAAAAIMIAVFGAFGVLGSAIEIAQIGLALAIAITVDAFIVRLTLIPAAMALLGDRAWRLPTWLDRVLPDADVEGRRLTAGPRDADAGAADAQTDSLGGKSASLGVGQWPGDDPT
ncbi:MAG: MMPL family transporter [Propionibacteriaceae bacterium]|nr:MMPL family transporter [Propionibacteriaceae bacterium]